MMADHSILDDVVATPVALMPALPSGYGPQIQTSRPVETPTGRKLQFGAPFFARGLTATHLSASWPVVCGLLRAKGLPLYATVEEMLEVPAANVPARIGQRFLGQPLIHTEVTTADAFELVNCAQSGSGWSWPYEITSGRDLKTLVQTLREATGAEIPIGMNLPLNAKVADLRMGIEASIDFLTLTHCEESLASSPGQVASLAAYGIVSARKLCTQLGRPKLPLLLDAPIAKFDHAIKLLALGASAINISKMLRSAMPTVEPKRYESKLTENLLGNLPSVPKMVRELPQVERVLTDLLQLLIHTLQFAGLIDIAELESNSVRGLSSAVAEQLGIAPITLN